jgi:hypothetical protein
MANILDNVIVFVQNNAFLIIAGIIVIFVVAWLFNKGRKKELKPISRSEVERKRFIDRNKLNKTSYKWLYRGKELLGKINFLKCTDLNESKIKSESEENTKPVLELVIRPALLNFGYLRFANPLGKEMCIMVNGKTVLDLNRANSEILIDEKVTFDKLFGIYYDRRYEPEAIEYIKTNSVFRTDWDNFASVYFVKAQEQATFNPQIARDMELKQMELQIEKEKRAKLVSGQ